MNLGQNPVVVTYYLDGTVLKMHDELLPSAIPSPDDIIIADNIVQFQAQYAYDGTNDGSIDANALTAGTISPVGGDQWGDSMPNTALVPGASPDNSWGNIIGIRFAIVSRSVTPERPDPTTNQCTATTANPVWGATGVQLDVQTSNPSEWKCYRYRVFEVTVPSRNRIWSPDEKL
jgi:type IV pilus assembly protein PilW